MASSTGLVLVNRILSTTGDYENIADLTTSPAGIASKIIDFFNIIVSDMEQASEWPELRIEEAFTAPAPSGSNPTSFISVNTNDIPPNGVSNVWVVGGDLLDELSPSQFDKVVAQNASGTVPRYFRRSYDSATSKPTIDIYPAPVLNDVVKVSMYRRATKLVITSPTGTPADGGTTEFDDGVLVYGVLAHMDAYDGVDGGYMNLYRAMKETAVSANTRNTLKVPLGEYVRWNKKVPNAWQDAVFRDSYMKEHPEYLGS